MPTLKKLQLEEGKDSMLPTGYTTTAREMMLYDYETDTRKSIENVLDVEVGWQVVLYGFTSRDYHRTSKIREIVFKEPGRVVFKTQTSLYELTG